ncbi:hypothetical protein JANAI62_08360 [Jannaschia pagri]|uniref:Flp pilus assembly protein, pilin Flp n=1 Tax=Jannaschia pagri TaxID=2829797 RepID=A0ABQ4NIG8_9RHOB|nr:MULTISPECIES: hypothetical protein [unclassified Jannaschia]GIT89679.1 hypothetical protein JANAI61_01370 [Jannaschia sp. AI_61]GIT94213.1 hypothetical protein JANAI62_08360 [Jannaschia sp. AI_62]
MGIKEHIAAFAADEDGSIVIDWVVISAAIIGISLFMFDGVAGSVEDLARDVEQKLASIEIPTTFADYESLR